jgi:pimeloyl-ACP methyl ester carboxylesterase
MATFVVAHGAWSAGWAWKKMHPLMAERGHQLVTPTLTGVGDRSHLARPEIDLETHIADIVAVLEFDDLDGVNLIGHSYGGMVATGVADRARTRISQLIYIDAFAPATARACAA